MAAPCFITWNASTTALTAPMAGTASSAVSGTVKTILQLRAPAAGKIRIIEWGYILTTTPTSPMQLELIETGAIGATVTAGTISNYSDQTGSASAAQSSGYNASAEGTIVATRLLAQAFDLATYFKQQFPLGREPEIGAGNYVRIRATPTTAAATTVMAYLAWEE